MSSEQAAGNGIDEPFYLQCEGDPLSSGWVRWTLEDRSRFNGQFGDLLTRRDGDLAIVRMQPHLGLANLSGGLHGGAIMAFLDVAMFVGARVLGIAESMGAATIDLNVQFVRAANIEQPVDVRVALTRETGRFMFVRGTIEQADEIVSTFVSLLRKPRQ